MDKEELDSEMKERYQKTGRLVYNENLDIASPVMKHYDSWNKAKKANDIPINKAPSRRKRENLKEVVKKIEDEGALFGEALIEKVSYSNVNDMRKVIAINLRGVSWVKINNQTKNTHGSINYCPTDFFNTPNTKEVFYIFYEENGKGKEAVFDLMKELLDRDPCEMSRGEIRALTHYINSSGLPEKSKSLFKEWTRDKREESK